MQYEWDQNKARLNLAKHKINFADAVAVFADEIVYTWRGEHIIRLISARKANKFERKQYE